VLNGRVRALKPKPWKRVLDLPTTNDTSPLHSDSLDDEISDFYLSPPSGTTGAAFEPLFSSCFAFYRLLSCFTFVSAYKTSQRTPELGKWL
jgi:hypothetical protein